MTTNKVARIITIGLVGALLGGSIGCEYYGPDKEATIVKESDSKTSDSTTESQGSSDTSGITDKITDLESKIEQEKNANAAASQTVIDGLQQEIDDLKNQLASAQEAAATAAATPEPTSPETPAQTPSDPAPGNSPSLTEIKPAVAVAKPALPNLPQTPSEKPQKGILADLALKAGAPVVVAVNAGDGRKFMAKDKNNQELRCSDLESTNPADASNRLVVIGFKVKSSHFGSYLGREEDYYQISKKGGDHYSPMVPGTGTSNIRHLSLICGRLGKDGVVRNPNVKTKEVGSNLAGDDYDHGFLAFEDSEGAGDEGDFMETSSWGTGENLPAQPNAVMTGIRMRIFQAQKSQARADAIADGEGEALGYYGYKPADMTDWNARHTPTDGKVIQSLKFYGAKLNPLGDPAKSDADDALIDTRAQSSADSPWLSGSGKGDLTDGFSCPANHVITGVNVRSNWFYGIVWIDSIECKEIVPLYQ